MTFRDIHLFIGTAGLIAFALQGQLMEHSLGVSELQDGERMMYRTSHLYLMLASVINIVSAVSPQNSITSATWEATLSRLCSILILLAPPLLATSFFLESSHPELERPLAAYTMYGVFGSGAALALIELKKRFSR